MCGPDGLLVQAHRVEIAALDASDLTRYQDVLIEKGDRTVLPPLLKLIEVHDERLVPLALPVERCRAKGRSDRERRIVVIVKQLDAAGRSPKQHLCLLGRCDRLRVVARDESRL